MAKSQTVSTVYIRLTKLRKPGRDNKKFKMQLFFDSDGTHEMKNEPLDLCSGGKIHFDFIPPAKGGATELADLVIIAQTESTGKTKATPFKHPSSLGILNKRYYPAYYLPQLQRATGVVFGGELGVIRVDKPRGPFKYTIVALCAEATQVTELDPCVIIRPR